MHDVDAGLLCAMVAAEDLAFPFHPVPDDAHPQCSQVGAKAWIAHSKQS
jgi:hypothetical protein